MGKWERFQISIDRWLNKRNKKSNLRKILHYAKLESLYYKKAQ